MQIVLVTPPTDEPLTVNEAKRRLRVDIADDDDLIGDMISAAREDAEKITRRQIMPATYKAVLDRFPAPSLETSSANWYGPAWGTGPGPLTMSRPEGRSGLEILLPRPPLVQVQSIKYIDQDGNQQTLAPSEYIVDSASEPARIVPAFGKAWPTTQNRINAVEIVFDAGYADAAHVPARIKSWIATRVGAMYENREEIAVGSRIVAVELPYIDRQLDDLRVVTF